MYNELFESIIRTSGENTDDLDNKDNFWASIPENLLFERVLREAGISPISIPPSSPPNPSNNPPQQRNPPENSKNRKRKPEEKEEKDQPLKEPGKGNLIDISG